MTGRQGLASLLTKPIFEDLEERKPNQRLGALSSRLFPLRGRCSGPGSLPAHSGPPACPASRVHGGTLSSLVPRLNSSSVNEPQATVATDKDVARVLTVCVENQLPSDRITVGKGQRAAAVRGSDLLEKRKQETCYWVYLGSGTGI